MNEKKEKKIEKDDSFLTKTEEEKEITEELKESYLDYAMSVIISRALPDVRDGLKPVQRRILWAMWDNGLTHSAKFKKSANVVGEVLGKYHPHGDSAVYDALARMAQDFSLRYPLIEGQGNWGSIDGDSPAAMRYTEARLSKIASEMLVDIEKDTVDWIPNYDNSRKEPSFLPAKLPNLLLNGVLGIAVGMATSIPPHNLKEVADAISYLIKNPDASIKDLMQFIKGPDFPTGGIVYGEKSLEEAYSTGKGSVVMRAKTEIEEKKNGSFQIVVSEIPYQVNKADLISKMAELVQDKKIEGIKDIRDESDREGLRIVIELKSDINPQKVLNQLFQYTDLQKSFHYNMLALVSGLQPQILSLKDILNQYIEHRKIVIKRKTEFDLKKAEERAHILEGLVKALGVIDKIIATIKKSKDKEEAKNNLIKNFKLTPIQAEAILEMKLQSLAALERQKLENELKEKRKLIEELRLILKEPKRILKIIENDLEELKKNYGDERKTKIIASGIKEFKEEDLIPEGDFIITLSEDGYIKRMTTQTFKGQKRGGKGLIGAELKEEDKISHIIYSSSHDNILFFTNKGKVYQTKAYEIPEASRTSKGRLIHNFLEISSEEKINALVSYPKNTDKKFLVMVTKNGIVKKTPLDDFQSVRRTGIIAISLDKDDMLLFAKLSSGEDEIILTTFGGQAIRFKEKDIRSMGRTASGVRGIKLKKGDYLSGADVFDPKKIKDLKLLVVTENGLGKQTLLKEYKLQKRGGSGIKAAKITKKTGGLVSAHVIEPEMEEIIAFSSKGQAIKISLNEIKVLGRQTQGVKIMNVPPSDKLIGVVCI
jgi:DNA gyrase subunit A